MWRTLYVRHTTQHHIAIFRTQPAVPASAASNRYQSVQHTHVDDAGPQRVRASPETLHPGDTLEYYCHAFVFGERNSHRVAIVTMVDATEGAEYPVDVDTGDVITRAMMTKRLADRFGKPFIPEATKRQKLRTYDLAAVSVSALRRPADSKNLLTTR
ncbi:hypothetical protein PC128_g1503 [Phytophthora cactorum]|nr:hypothetical protein PC128_g1503 [Phytophthora cactorum]